MIMMINKEQQSSTLAMAYYSNLRKVDRFIEVDWSRLIQDIQVIVKVKDTGTGIDPEILPRLFSKFVSKSFEGTGLGLFICKSVVEAHDGKICAENNNNINTQRERGGTFSFTLPTINRQQNVKVVDDQ